MGNPAYGAGYHKGKKESLIKMILSGISCLVLGLLGGASLKR